MLKLITINLGRYSDHDLPQYYHIYTRDGKPFEHYTC